MIVGYSAHEVAAAERPLLGRGEPLMQRAAFALALRVTEVLRSRAVARCGPRPGARSRERRVVMLVGSGGNGGDTLMAGARLAARGTPVTAFGLGARVNEDGVRSLRHVGGAFIPVRGSVDVRDAVGEALRGDVILDGIVGIGAGAPGLRQPAREVVQGVAERLALLDRHDRPSVVAVDLPSGIGVDDGRLPRDTSVLPADLTISFGATKAGLLLPPAARMAGRVEVVDLGLELTNDPATPADTREPSVGAQPPAARERTGRVHRLEGADLVAQRILRRPGSDVDKYRRGVLGVVAGTEEFPGAAQLTVRGALGVGMGMVRHLGAQRAQQLVLGSCPEVVTAEGRVQAWTVGPGIPVVPGDDVDDLLRPASGRAISPEEQARRALAQACGSPGVGLARAEVPVPCVVDAGALSLLPRHVPATVVLTPHAGELSRLLRHRGHDVDRAGVESEPLRWAHVAHEETGATVLLKGAVTVVVGETVSYAQDDATPWLATAGAGDVLAGVLGALLATHSERVLTEPDAPATVAAAAALLHGWAADRATTRLTAGGASPGPDGPITASAVARELPATCAALLAAHS